MSSSDDLTEGAVDAMVYCREHGIDPYDRIAQLEADLERTRQAWVDGEDPMCEDVCVVACKGPCGVLDGRFECLPGNCEATDE